MGSGDSLLYAKEVLTPPLLSNMEFLHYMRNVERRVEERLDRFLCTKEWVNLFPNARVSNLELTSSDHLPVLLSLSRREEGGSNRRFRFNNVWLSKKACQKVVSDCWNGMSNFDISKKLRESSVVLESWSKGLSEVSGIISYPFNEEEVYWKKRAKNVWFNGGDANTLFFHNAASTRRRVNRIEKLRGEESGELQIRRFMRCIRVQPCISKAQTDCLNLSINAGEVIKAVFSMHNDKTPGSDSFNPTFFKSHWDVVGSDVVKNCQELFMSGAFYERFNDTAIVLVPKVSNPESVSDLKPLCNVIYKFFSKVLANRMKHLMPVIISETQSAFVENRLITDNFLIAYEIVHYLRRKGRGKDGWAALKIDISKTYNRVRWRFVEGMMSRQGFNRHWVDIIMACISSVCYMSVGDCFDMDPLVPSQGLRQGDPLSPYLFIICAEGLSFFLAERERTNLIHGVKICRGALTVSHLFFADDSYLFFEATCAEMVVVKEVLYIYEALSGQKINYNMSNILFSNLSEKRGISWARLCTIGGLGFQKVGDFNVAMLARQAWQLTIMSDSLMANFFKARYFPNVSFLEAKLGSNPSFIWRSIFESQLVVRVGARVRIGNGRYVETPCPDELRMVTMDQLMEVQNRTWDKKVLANIFSQKDVDCIFSVPLSYRDVNDG
ncbi:uncharacterized protein LOC126661591 [Mercurialis annua]|uniref:uncharacterized protein LOC126661591 n=1 Tax=Mercurialis annua TaxID=3986 RepID=UPI00215F20E5|nr:uncharacterized protein LOC126661591 [Mercurialis annua]